MPDATDEFWGGVILTTIVVVCLNLMPWAYRTQAVKALEECEKTLPRNQECMITAIPKEQTP